MRFTSFLFIVFFIVIYTLYLSLNHKRQNRLLLVASYCFYGAWDWRFLGLIMLSTATDYLCSQAIHASQDNRRRKFFLFVSLGINLGILCFFKYFNFFLDNAISLAAFFGLQLDHPTMHIILPVGISFYTFQGLSYTIDVYRKQMPPEPDFGNYALFVSFFPQLVAGPIERASRLIPQIAKPRTISEEQLKEGALLIFWGFFKKVFIADHIGVLLRNTADPFTLAASGDGGLVLASGWAYLIQLYCDFSAYSDLARGLGKVMGFELMENFRSPFFSSSIQEVWTRWHISLTTWVRDYVYLPLALIQIKRRSLPPYALVMITFLLIGLWHGAAWNYIVWGAVNGLLLVSYSFYKKHKRKLARGVKMNWSAPYWRVLATIVTFNVCAYVALTFRASTVQQVFDWLRLVVTNPTLSEPMLLMTFSTIVYALPMLVIDYLLYKKNDINAFYRAPLWARLGLAYAGIYLIVVHKASFSEFIYFQF